MSREAIDLVVGSYAARGGGGLYPLRFEPRAARLTLGVPYGHVRNASFGVHGPRGGRAYFVDEQADGRLGAFGAAEAGWPLLRSVGSGGDAPCHLAIDEDGRMIAVANYEDGVVAAFRLDPASGEPLAPPALHRLSGGGPNRERQAGPHAHWVGFDAGGRWLYCVDLGADRILRIAADPDRGALGEAAVAYAAPPGSGPRHLAFHPRLPLAFLVSELASTLTLLRIAGGGMEALQIVSTLPVDAERASAGGAIVLNRAGDRIFVSNRGHDSVAAFALENGNRLHALGHVPSGGASPRFLLLLEGAGHLLVANDEGGSVVALRLREDGLPGDVAATVAVPGAAFLGVATRA